MILDAVEHAGGNVTRAAETLGLHPNYLHRLISNLELRDRFKGEGIGRAAALAPPHQLVVG